MTIIVFTVAVPGSETQIFVGTFKHNKALRKSSISPSFALYFYVTSWLPLHPYLYFSCKVLSC